MIFNRVWAMPNSNTFDIKPINELLKKYLEGKSEIIDPFSRDSKFATETNDLNPGTNAKHHMDAVEFIDMFVKNGKQFDAALLDPPYSPRQLSECYQNIGRKVTQKDTQNGTLYKECKDRLSLVLKKGGIAVTCGWNSMGFGINRGFKMIEILLVPHGGPHNDTIVVVEEKI